MGQQIEFSFLPPQKTVFGSGSVSMVLPAVTAWGSRALIVCGKGQERAERLLGLPRPGLETVFYCVSGEPSISSIRECLETGRAQGVQFVISIGGGSAIDTGKAVSALLSNDGELLDYLEVIGKGRPLDNAPLPFAAVPTTAGTGAEATRNAVIFSPEHQVKVSLRSEAMLPRLAVIDPELTYSMPPSVTADTGLDAFTQVLEPFVSLKANPLTDAFCREGMRRASRSLLKAWENGNDAAAREDMSLCSYLGGMALANAGLGAVHGIAGPLGGMVGAPHGALCARLLPFVIEENVRKLDFADRECPAFFRYREAARIVCGRDDALTGDMVDFIFRLCERMKVRQLAEYGLKEDDIPLAAEKALKASSMKGNPIQLSQAEVEKIIRAAL